MEQHPPIPPGGDQQQELLNRHEPLPPDPEQAHVLSAIEQPVSLPDVGFLSPDMPEAVVAAAAAVTQTERSTRRTGEPAIERRSNKELLTTAKQAITVLADVVRRNERLPGIRELARYFIISDNIHAPVDLLYRASRGGQVDLQEVKATVADNAIFYLWSRSKVVYAMDDLLLAYLSASGTSQIPTQILRSLPHADPYLLLPKPDLTDPQTTYYRTHIGVPLGAFVFGRYNQAQQLCSAADNKREDLGLMFVGFIDREDGATDPVTLRCTIPLKGQTLTVEDAVSATIGKFNFNEHLAEDDPAKLEAWLRTYVAQAFNSLLYVCTEQPDIEVYRPGTNRPGKQAKSRERRRPRPDDIQQVVKLGFRMGPALHQARAQWERSQQQPAGGATGDRRVRPHQKKAHYRTYWTGAGRVEPILKWIAPFWVNENLLGTTDEPSDVVVRPVRKWVTDRVYIAGK
jgi:hypothetical protein